MRVTKPAWVEHKGGSSGLSEAVYSFLTTNEIHR
jgi:hypothetical protein